MVKRSRMLGTTGVEVSRLGLGGHTFLSRYGGMGRAQRGELLQIVRTAIDAGINLFDVTYDEEREVLGSLIRELRVREQLFLSCWMSRQRTQTGTEVIAEARRALELLGLDSADLFYLDWTATPEQLEAMAELRRQGATRFVGVLGTEAALAAALEPVDVVLVNHNYYLRDKEPMIISLARRYPHLGIIALEPLGRGRFAGEAGGEGVDMVAASLKYALSFPPPSAVLVAVRTLSQLEQDIAILRGDWQLTKVESDALAAGRGYAIPDPA